MNYKEAGNIEGRVVSFRNKISLKDDVTGAEPGGVVKFLSQYLQQGRHLRITVSEAFPEFPNAGTRGDLPYAAEPEVQEIHEVARLR